VARVGQSHRPGGELMERARRDISAATTVASALLLLAGGVFVPAVPHRHGLESVGAYETAPGPRVLPAL